MDKCLVEECQNAPVLYGLCLDHYDQTIHPSSGIRHGRLVTMAGKLFDSLTYGAKMQQDDPAGNLVEVPPVLPVVEVPFISEQGPHFILTGASGNVQPVETHDLRLREELVEGIRDPNLLERPIVFLVTTNIPHTSIYILYRGQLYSVGYGYEEHGGNITSALYSTDIPLGRDSEARIVWIGILTNAIRLRMQHEFDQVTEVAFNRKTITDDASNPIPVVDRLMFFHVPKKYGGLKADTSATEWNCSKWAMNVIFGDKKPRNFRELVSRTNIGLREDQLTLFLEAYRGKDQAEFIRVLKQINDPRFPKGGRRKRMTNKNGMKGKPIKMRRTTRKRTRKT
jgi:hypothetical protein